MPDPRCIMGLMPYSYCLAKRIAVALYLNGFKQLALFGACWAIPR
ncbi:MAG: hypothetical protein ACRC01_07020 [Deefgea sp.]